LIFGSLVTLVGVFCSMSFGGFDDFSKILNISFFDFLDYLSSKYMLPIGGLFTALFILSKWGVKNFISQLSVGMEKVNINPILVKILFAISAVVVGFIIFNEVFAKLTGNAIIG